jgi:hypothetical protein
MLPAAYQVPAALVLLLGGAVACFFGYRSFRIVLAIFGFVIGALIPSSFLPMSSGTWTMLAVALVGGLLGAGVLLAAYFVGVALVGAGLGAVAANLMFAATGQDPHFLVLVLMTLLGRRQRCISALLHHCRDRLRRGLDADRRGGGTVRGQDGAGGGRRK